MNSTYDGQKARYELALILINQLLFLEELIQSARQAELSFASNATVSTDDFDSLLQKVEALSIEVECLKDANRRTQ